MTVNYRESFGLHASCGILFNHESPLRGTEFVTRKISLGLARIAHGRPDPVKLGNLSAQRDWGFAGDYVRGMWHMLQQENPDDYVLATGRTNTVRVFVEQAAASLGMDVCWEGQGVDEVGIDRRTGRTVVVVDPAFRRPAEVYCLVGDASKAKQKLCWEPQVTMEELAAMMTSADYDRVGANRLKF